MILIRPPYAAERENMSMEIWKQVEGYEDYEVSSWGKVRNKTTHDILWQERHDKGYMRVNLMLQDKRHHLKVHRLVAQAFVPNPDRKPQVNHKDGNNRNNSFTNLEWVTDAENKAHQKAMIAVTKKHFGED